MGVDQAARGAHSVPALPPRRTRRGAALAAAVLIAGCGSAASGGGLSASDLASRADSICTHIDAQVAAADARVPTMRGPQGTRLTFIATARAGLPFSDHGLAELKALRPATAGAADWRRFLADVEQEDQGEHALLRAAVANDLSTAQRVQLAMQSAASDLQAIGSREGMHVCGQRQGG